MGPADLTLQGLAFRFLALLIIAGVQGAIIAGTAVLLGDRGPGYDGRLTAVPSSHVDLLGAIGAVIFGLGWGRPVDIDTRQLSIGEFGGAIVIILAAFLGLLVTAAVFQALILPALTTLPHAAALETAAFLRSVAGLCMWFALLGLVPIPPLTAGLLLTPLGINVSRRTRTVLAVVLLAAIATGMARRVLGPVHDMLAAVILGQ